MAILFDSVEMDVALHVSRTVAVMLSVRVCSELQASCHCSFVKWLYCNSSMSLYIWFELLSKNFICESSIFFFWNEVKNSRRRFGCYGWCFSG